MNKIIKKIVLWHCRHCGAVTVFILGAFLIIITALTFVWYMTVKENAMLWVAQENRVMVSAPYH